MTQNPTSPGEGWTDHDGEVRSPVDGSPGLYDFVMADGRLYEAQRAPRFWHGVKRWRSHNSTNTPEAEGGAG